MRDKMIELLMNIPKPPNMISVGYRCAESGGRLFNAAVLADYLIAHGVVVQEWIPVSERLPEDGKISLITYLRYDNGKPISDGMAVRSNGVWYWWYEEGIDTEEVAVEVTHWMPLPEPPKGE